MNRIDRSYIRHVRYAFQWSIVFFLAYAGYSFSVFVNYYASGATGAAPAARPPSVEGFLPIGALMALKAMFASGVIDRVHPAGLVIFVSALLLAVLLKKGFCGWICPVGAISDLTWKLGRRAGLKVRMPWLADYPLRSLKYLLMGFFLYTVVVKMSSPAIEQFLGSDYYRIADVRMLYFFTNMTTVTAVSLGVLFGLSLFFRNFWCRYLCPYGALLGLMSICSPLKITRNASACIDCGRCAKTCPAFLPVDRKTRMRSPECTGCLTCVSHCPSKGALEIAISKRLALKPLLFALLVGLLFFGAIGGARLGGIWNGSVSPSEYERLVPAAASSEHP